MMVTGMLCNGAHVDLKTDISPSASQTSLSTRVPSSNSLFESELVDSQPTTPESDFGKSSIAVACNGQKLKFPFRKALAILPIVILSLFWQRYAARRARSSQLFGFKSSTAFVFATVAAIVRCLGFRKGPSDFSENPQRVPKRQALICIHPHGAYMQGIGVHLVPELQGEKGGSLGNLHVVAADAVFQVPIFREICLSLGMRSASNRVLDKLLEDGGSVALAPGGIHEQLKTDPEREQLFFAPGLGFVRTAMKHGVPLVPLYNFGENQLYNIPRWSQRISDTLRKIGVGFKLGVGRWNLPIPLTHSRIETRFGREIDMGPPNPNPSDAQVEQVFRIYCKELLRLFDEHKSALPPAVAAHGLSLVWRGHESVDLSTDLDDTNEPRSSKASKRSRL